MEISYRQWQGEKERENIGICIIKKNCDCSWKCNSWCSVAQLARPDPNRKINPPPLSDSSMANHCLTRTGRYHARLPFHFVSAQGSPPVILSVGGWGAVCSPGHQPCGGKKGRNKDHSTQRSYFQDRILLKGS